MANLTPEFVADILQRYKQHFTVTEVIEQLKKEKRPISRPYVQALFSQFSAEGIQKYDRRQLG